MNLRLIAAAWIFILSLATMSALAVAQTGVVDPRSEIAAALYAASATQAAAQKLEDTQIESQRAQIADLQKQVHAGDAKRRAALSAAQEQFVAALAAKDRAYGQEIAVFRGAVTDIASTPDGAAALAQFNNGDEAGALAILDKLQAANDAARKARADIESAAEKRRIAELALEANNRGKVSITSVIQRYEEVTKLDPGVAWDWVELDRLYQSAGRLRDARNAAQNVARVATAERDRAVSFNELGNVAKAEGDLAGARKAYEEMLAIARHLSASDPGNADGERDISVSLDKTGDVAMAQGDLAGARKVYEESLAIDRRLLATDPGNVSAQRDISVDLNKTGDVAKAEGDLVGARKAYEGSLAVARRLSAADPGNANAQRDVSVSLEKAGDVAMAQRDLAGARNVFEESLAIRRRLSAADPGNAGAQRDVSVSLERIGDAGKAGGDLAGARKAYEEMLAIDRRLSAADPGNAGAQRDVSVDLNRAGDLAMAERDLAGARKAFEESLAIRRGLSAADPSNADSQRDIVVSLSKLAAIPNSDVHWSDVVTQMERMDRNGTLAPADRKFLEEARRNAAKEVR